MPAMNTLVIAILLVGALAFASMRREVFPEFDLEIVLVTVPYPGATPDEVEEGICQKVEEACRSVAGIKKITSVAQEGMGYCVFELQDSIKDVQKTLGEIRSEVERIPSMPELAEDPKIEQVTLRTPAIKVGVLAPQNAAGDITSELELRDVAEVVRDDLLALPAVPRIFRSISRFRRRLSESTAYRSRKWPRSSAARISNCRAARSAASGARFSSAARTNDTSVPRSPSFR